MVYEWELEGRRVKRQQTKTGHTSQTMRNLEITPEDAQERDQLRAIISANVSRGQRFQQQNCKQTTT